MYSLLPFQTAILEMDAYKESVDPRHWEVTSVPFQIIASEIQ